MIAARYAIPVALMLMLALVPTVIHSYLNLTEEDGRSISNINSRLGNFTSTDTSRKAGWVKEIFDTDDWLERTYTSPEGKSLRLFVARSFDHKRLYHHPELALSYGKDLRGRGQIRLPGQVEIPVNLLHHEKQANMAAFVLFYDGHFIDNPISHQFKDALEQLVSARKPLTLFYVMDDNAADDIPFEKGPAADLLQKAINDFIAQGQQ